VGVDDEPVHLLRAVLVDAARVVVPAERLGDRGRAADQ
jgi:hypothetical protein